MISIAGREWYPEKERLLADGAWGTELMRRGLSPGDAPERMNLENPDTVRQVALDYLNAGSDIILTNTFTGSRCQLGRHGLAERASEINKKGAEIAVGAATAFAGVAARPANGTGRSDFESAESGADAAAGEAARPDPDAARPAPAAAQPARFFPRPLVAGSMGPTGKMVVMGEIGLDELLEVFRQQAESLAAGGADLILVETMTDLEEMRIAVRAGVKTGLPVIASMTYDRGNAGYRTIMGNSPEKCAEAALSEGAAMIGANCGTGIENYMDLASELCALAKAPVWIKANAGLPQLAGKEVVYRQTAEEYAGFIPQLLNAGVNIAGGCCGTSPAFIAAMRRQFDAWLAGRF